MKIQKLIDALETAKEDIRGSHHQDIDNVHLVVRNSADEYDDLELEIIGFDMYNMWGCMCPYDCIIEVKVTKEQ